jgi:predicted RNA binding protein YcfA (HicA-like mRNA interferase family)
MTRTRRMNADEVERILERYGFELISQKGSHRKWRNLDRQLQVIVPYHKGVIYRSAHSETLWLVQIFQRTNGKRSKVIIAQRSSQPSIE